MAKIEAEKKEFIKIFSDFWFEIPDYQRSYVWEKDQVCELLDDLWYAFENKENDNDEYFLGSLVLKKKENSTISEFEVLDGQQRLQSLYIGFRGSFDKEQLYLKVDDYADETTPEMHYRFVFM
ncbi:MAG: DUF262 domain-containing protein, partial [Candidatus Methanoperedens sp.]|nr:DUF262 domain-containing protein [Candidatus Methanoperedens sp.]